ncbi:thioredoxin family protein [Duncaniella muris]|uniref:Thioredoxin n=1 Tax=Duncaniella muris TaxID=2094150 RepID=A0A2V1ILM0_9BACT|nr:thioredoxin [Duncaniella muris]
MRTIGFSKTFYRQTASARRSVCLHFYQPLKLSNIMTYDQEIRSSKVVLMEFYASWCPHCQRMMPVVAQVKELLDGRANVCQLDIDNNKEAAEAADVRSIPSFLIYVDGKEAWRHTGEIDGEVLLSKIESFL